MKILITIIAICFAPLTLAQGFDWDGTSLELLVGQSDQKLRAGDDHHKETNTSYGIRAGLPVSDHFTIETSYRDYGEYDHSYVDSSSGFGNFDFTDKIHTTSFDVGMKGALHFIDHNIAFIYRVGFSAYETELDISAPVLGIDDSDTNSGVAPYYGVGLQYIHPSGFMISWEVSEFHYDDTIDTTNLYGDYSSTIHTHQLAIGYSF